MARHESIHAPLPSPNKLISIPSIYSIGGLIQGYYGKKVNRCLSKVWNVSTPLIFVVGPNEEVPSAGEMRTIRICIKAQSLTFSSPGFPPCI